MSCNVTRMAEKDSRVSVSRETYRIGRDLGLYISDETAG